MGDGPATAGYPGLNRRVLLGGFAAACVSGPAWARQEPDEAELTALSVNLITRMAALVSVNGTEPRPFVIDTGAERTVVSNELAAMLALPAGPPSLIHGVTSFEVAPTVRVGRMAFAGRQFEDLVAPTFPLAALGAYGLVGLDALSEYRLMVDFRRQGVFLQAVRPNFISMNPTDGLTGTRIRRASVRARQGRFGQLLLPTEVEGVRIDAFVDSGSQYSIANTALLDAIGRRTGSGDTQTITRRILGVTGHALEGVSHRVSDLRVANRRFGPADLVFSDLHIFTALELDRSPALLIGADILCQFDSVTLDFALSRVAFGTLRRRRTR
jgi:predicted aspartyl protease